MRKNIIISLICTALLTLCLGAFNISKTTAYASSDNIEYFLPSSPYEFFDLKSPTAIDYSEDGYLIIAEHKKDENFLDDDTKSYNRLVVYNPNEGYTTIDGHGVLNGNNTIFAIPQVKKYGNFVYYLYNSSIYRLNLNNLELPPENTGVYASTFFDFYNNTLIANTSGSIEWYEIDNTTSTPTFNKKQNLSFSTGKTTLGIITENSVIYYYDSDKGSIFSYNDGSATKKQLSQVSKVDNMVKLGDYLYFTSSTDGIYKLNVKIEGSTPIKILETDTSLNRLGGINTPQGLAVKGENLLIADSSLNAIQEYSTSKNDFTSFAITTENSADFRLTYNASQTSLSENYLYVLDNNVISTDPTIPKKRIIKISTNNLEKNCVKLDFSKFYEEDVNFNITKFVASDDYLLIFTGEKLMLLKINGEELSLIKTITDTSISSLTYLDGAFYFTNNTNKDNKPLINVNKISVPSLHNNLTEVKQEKINEGFEDEGVCQNMTVDVFGNIYMVIKNANTTLLVRFFKKSNPLTTISEEIVKLQTDFSGNVYALTSDKKILKFSTTNNITTKTQIDVDNNHELIDLSLNYRYDCGFILSKGYVLKTANNLLQIQNMSKISANLVDNTALLNNLKFVSVSKDAKMFKVDTTLFNEVDGNKYFKELVPVSNPNTENVYLVISELDDYYLVSYTSNFVALVRKSSVDLDLSLNADATLISEQDYYKYGINITDINQEFLITNDTKTLSKPIYDDIYSLQSISKNQKVYAVKRVEFNGKTLTLISNSENEEPIGYIVSGYLTNDVYGEISYQQSSKTVIGGNYKNKIKTSLMITLIAFTLSLTLLFIEYKLLFKKDKN